MTTREHDERARAAAPRRPVIRVGERLVGRYRIVEVLPAAPLAERFRAEDEASARSVLIRVARPELLPDEVARRRVAARLEAFVGQGGTFLPGLLDAGLDDQRVYVVEPMPEGVRLLEVLEGRIAARRRFKAEEILPVAARIAAAIEALPSSACHGEVVAEHVHVSPDGLALAEGFLGCVLPETSVRACLGEKPLPPGWAPEWATGAVGPAADVYGLGMLVLSMLTGELPTQGPRRVPASLGAVGDALVPMIDPEPRRRPRSTRPLLEALARHAGLPFPELDPGRFSPIPRTEEPDLAASFDQERTVMMPMPELEEHAARSSQPQPAAEPDSVEPEPDDDDDDDLAELPEEQKTRQVSLASLGPRIDELGGDDDDITPPDGTPLGALAHGDPDAPIPPLPPPDVAEALAPPRLASASRAASAPKAPPPARRTEAGAPAASGPVLAPPVIAKPPQPAKPAVLPPPAAVAPLAPPKPASVPPPKPVAAEPPAAKPPAAKPPAKPLPPTPVVRSADPPPATAPEGPPSQPTISVSPIASVPEPPKRRGPSLDITSTVRNLPTIRPMRPPTIATRANARIIGMAVAIAVAILGGSLGFAAFRKYKEEAAREERLRERFERIKSGDSP